MSNPLEDSMKQAQNKMLIENMRESMKVQIECAIMVAEIRAAHFKKLISEGLDAISAATITAHYLTGSSE